MKKPMKPEKKELAIGVDWLEGYNQALSDYEAWMPGVEEIEKIVEDIWCGLMGTSTTNSERFKEIATAIAKRLKGET